MKWNTVYQLDYVHMLFGKPYDFSDEKCGRIAKNWNGCFTVENYTSLKKAGRGLRLLKSTGDIEGAPKV